MKQVIINNIKNMQYYLVSDAAQHDNASLSSASLDELWAIHDELVVQLKGII